MTHLLAFLLARNATAPRVTPISRLQTLPVNLGGQRELTPLAASSSMLSFNDQSRLFR